MYSWRRRNCDFGTGIMQRFAGIARLKYLIVYHSLCRFAPGDPWVPKHKVVCAAMLSFSYPRFVSSLCDNGLV